VHYTIYGSTITIYQLKPIAAAPFNIGQLFTVLYLAGVLFLMIRLAWQLISLKRIINQPETATSYAFFKKVKLNEHTTENDIIATHEQVHAKQWHSADVLIIEAVMIINWFNPVVYMYRYAVKHIHEFIADSHTLKAGTNKADYAMLLLSQTFNAPQHQLVSNFFNKSLLKQRIIMLQKNKSQRIALIKYGLSAPLFILMLILSSATVNNSKAVKKVNIIAQNVFNMPADEASLSRIITVKLMPPDTSGRAKISASNKAINHTITLEIKAERDKAASFVTEADTNQVFEAVEQEPTFSGFNEYLAKNIHYPAVDYENNVQGKVFLQFIVEKDGSISNIKPLRGPSATIIAEAVRVVSNSPKWNPGVQNGRPVRVQYTVPISFTLAPDDNGTTNNSQMLSGAVVTSYKFTKPDSSKKPFTITLTPPNNPLYVVDGKIMDANFDLKLIDVKSIKSLTVLKDATARAIYGSRAANGVIIVATNSK